MRRMTAVFGGNAKPPAGVLLPPSRLWQKERTGVGYCRSAYWKEVEHLGLGAEDQMGHIVDYPPHELVTGRSAKLHSIYQELLRHFASS